VPEDETPESTTTDDNKYLNSSVAEIKEAAAKPPESEADIGPSAQR
jgi:hypothetical protein